MEKKAFNMFHFYEYKGIQRRRVYLILELINQGGYLMKLFQVRKGQFVFYENELHKVYSVKPMFKKICSHVSAERYETGINNSKRN